MWMALASGSLGTRHPPMAALPIFLHLLHTSGTVFVRYASS